MKPRVIAHMDMDAFFAAIEQRDDPKLRGKPVVVGADPKGGQGRGVVSTCSYEARKFGIHSAMPISRAYRLCPHACFVRGSGRKYREVSHQIFKILYDFTPDIQPISVDEAFLDLTGTYHFYKTPKATAQAIKDRIKKEIELNASIGIAPVKFVAKIASDESKPDGLLEILPDGVLDFLTPLRINKLWGVGKKTQQALEGMGIKTIGDIARIDPQELHERLGVHGLHLYDLARGVDEREVIDDDDIKSVSHEHTFEHDIDDRNEIDRTLMGLSEKVSRRLRKYELKGKTLTVKIRLKGFKTYTRAATFSTRTNFADTIYKQSKRIFDVFYQKGMKIRLLGVRLANFDSPYIREDLFEDKKDIRNEKVHKAVDYIKDRFGEEAIHRGMT